mmetsp:Transcript_10760/g.34214  ORF Transcript_10760/g.34214 Transcript_10760/m.34214 type:complete len:275 (-) Transcript_10760:504-1328(-)
MPGEAVVPVLVLRVLHPTRAEHVSVGEVDSRRPREAEGGVLSVLVRGKVPPRPVLLVRLVAHGPAQHRLAPRGGAEGNEPVGRASADEDVGGSLGQRGEVRRLRALRVRDLEVALPPAEQVGRHGPLHASRHLAEAAAVEPRVRQGVDALLVRLEQQAEASRVAEEERLPLHGGEDVVVREEGVADEAEQLGLLLVRGVLLRPHPPHNRLKDALLLLRDQLVVRDELTDEGEGHPAEAGRGGDLLERPERHLHRRRRQLLERVRVCHFPSLEAV